MSRALYLERVRIVHALPQNRQQPRVRVAVDGEKAFVRRRRSVVRASASVGLIRV